MTRRRSFVRNPKDTGPAENYTVEATGAYAKLKKFNTGDDMSENPCPGLSTQEGADRSFTYLPEDSKTKFILFEGFEAYPYDGSSIRFRKDQ